jgi:methionine aminotransferase
MLTNPPLDVAVPVVQSRLPTVDRSIFTVMTELANEHGAVNLSQGFPDFSPDPALVEAVHRAHVNGHNQYAPAAGLLSLRERITDFTAQQYGTHYDPAEEITITSGATEAIYVTLAALLQPEDEVIIFEPCYDSYVPAITLNGGIPVHIPLAWPGYTIDWDIVKRYINRKTRAIIINSPHNPTGTALTADDYQQLTEITRGKQIVVVSDEVYEYITYDGHRHTSVAALPELAQRSVKISSFGKSLHATGWKIGYALAPAALTREIRKVHQFVTFSTHTPAQQGIAEYLAAHPEAITGIRALYQEKKDLFAELMSETAFEPLPTLGSYFQLYTYSRLSQEDDQTFCRRLVEAPGVAAIPISGFYRNRTDHHVIRFCFAKQETTLRLAVERLKRLAPAT